MEIYGVPPQKIIGLSTRSHLFFHKNGEPILSANSRGKIRKPNTKKLSSILKCTDSKFLDFLNRCFAWDPVKRITPIEALQHPWIIEGLPENIISYHQKLFTAKENSDNLKKATETAIQGFPSSKKDITIEQMVEEIT